MRIYLLVLLVLLFSAPSSACTENELPTNEKEMREYLLSLVEVWRDDEGRISASRVKTDEIGDVNVKDIPLLVTFLGDAEHRVSQAAEAVLAAVGEDAIPALIEAYNTGNESVRLGAIGALGKIEPITEDALDVLLKALKDPDMLVRERAASSFLSLTPDASITVPALIEALSDEYSLVCSHAATALGHYGPDAIDAVPELLEGLKDERKQVRSSSLNALANISNEPYVIDAIIGMLDDESHWVRKYAAFSLGKIGPVAEMAIDPLIESLDDDDSIAAMAAIALGRIGQASTAAIPRLREMLTDPDEMSMISALFALFEIGDKPVERLNALVEFLGSEDKDLRDWAVMCLGYTGPQAAAAVPALLKSLKDDSIPVRWMSADALAVIGPEEGVIEGLIGALNDEESIVRSKTAIALGSFGTDASDALPRLRQLAENDKSESVREAAQEAIEAIEQKIGLS